MGVGGTLQTPGAARCPLDGRALDDSLLSQAKVRGHQTPFTGAGSLGGVLGTTWEGLSGQGERVTAEREHGSTSVQTRGPVSACVSMRRCVRLATVLAPPASTPKRAGGGQVEGQGQEWASASLGTKPPKPGPAWGPGGSREVVTPGRTGRWQPAGSTPSPQGAHTLSRPGNSVTGVCQRPPVSALRFCFTRLNMVLRLQSYRTARGATAPTEVRQPVVAAGGSDRPGGRTTAQSTPASSGARPPALPVAARRKEASLTGPGLAALALSPAPWRRPALGQAGSYSGSLRGGPGRAL